MTCAQHACRSWLLMEEEPRLLSNLMAKPLKWNSAAAEAQCRWAVEWGLQQAMNATVHQARPAQLTSTPMATCTAKQGALSTAPVQAGDSPVHLGRRLAQIGLTSNLVATKTLVTMGLKWAPLMGPAV